MTIEAARRRNRHQEDDLQKAVVQYLRLVLDASEYRVFAIPNGGRALILLLLAAGAVPFAARSFVGRVVLAVIVGDVVARWLAP